jgi:hypothetical protein
LTLRVLVKRTLPSVVRLTAGGPVTQLAPIVTEHRPDPDAEFAQALQDIVSHHLHR